MAARLPRGARFVQCSPSPRHPALSPLDSYISIWLYSRMEILSPDPERLDHAFSALADPTRRAILARLATGEATVSELMAPFDLSQPTISKHLKVLEDAGFIQQGREAQRRPRRLVTTALEDVAGWIEPFRRLWEARFDNLDRHLGRMSKREKQRAAQKSKVRQGRDRD